MPIQFLQSLIKRLVWILSFRQNFSKGQFLPNIQHQMDVKKACSIARKGLVFILTLFIGGL
ncbi:MAG TPA: hypothetical protein DIT28_09570 [Oxalobacteraceae bacterium]|nr:hypothetical protein [Oxalobacteraceae bacterium]